ncbi:MAG TPA: hypothetical protein VGL66_17295 [Caulobacteraceae bacterium]|jgi:hypothetical protein
MRALFVIFSALLWVFTTSGAADAQTPVKYLDWPGKSHPQPATPVMAPQAAPEPAAQGVAPEPVVAVAAPPQTFAPQTFTPQTFTPTSIYDAPPPVPVAAASAATPAVAVVASAAPAIQDRARRYSLARDYGEQPDHIAIPAPVYLDHLPVGDVDKANKASKQAKDDAERSHHDDADDDDGDSDGGAG